MSKSRISKVNHYTKQSKQELTNAWHLAEHLDGEGAVGNGQRLQTQWVGF